MCGPKRFLVALRRNELRREASVLPQLQANADATDGGDIARCGSRHMVKT
jgi:hypothetical protein